jgi:ABC-type branched-subunit amino acid transport system substrate-binding protein
MVAFFLITAFVLVACGQKEGVHGGLVAAPGVDPGTGAPVTPGVDPGTGVPVDPGTGVPVDPGTGTPVDPGAQPGTGPGSGPVIGSDRTGIFENEIVLGLHAPETGAAPIQAKVFDAGKELYWKWLHEIKGDKLFGRTVRVVTADDQYRPTTAVSVCNKMASQDKAFLLIGGAGTDQINACASFADQRGIPYLSPGVQEAGLNTRRTYFAVTMTYRAQMKPLVQMLKAESKRKRPNTPNFNDADAELEAAVGAAGWEYDVYSVVKEGNSTEAQTVATQMQQDKVDIAVPITAPTFTTQLAINTGKNNYKPVYAGVAISNNINQMINLACQNDQFEGALWLSPWPGWKQVNAGQYDKDFRVAAERFAAQYNKRDKGGDLLLALWGIMKNIHQMFLAAGENVTRESFVATMNNFRVNPGAFPSLQCSPTNHFCARNTFVLEGACNDPQGAQWVTHSRYKNKASSF